MAGISVTIDTIRPKTCMAIAFQILSFLVPSKTWHSTFGIFLKDYTKHT